MLALVISHHLDPPERLASCYGGILDKIHDRAVADLRVLSGLFSLTRAEARVARELASGRSAEDAAKSLGVSLNTVKTHTKAIFRKTGVSRHGELVALLVGLVLPSR